MASNSGHSARARARPRSPSPRRGPSAHLGPLVAQLEGHLGAHPGPRSAWFVGVARDPRRRLFAEHAVRVEDDAWAWIAAPTETLARAAAHYFHELGYPGALTFALDARVVYVYRRTAWTRPGL